MKITREIIKVGTSNLCMKFHMSLKRASSCFAASLRESAKESAKIAMCTYWIDARIRTSLSAFCLSFSVSFPILTYVRAKRQRSV